MLGGSDLLGNLRDTAGETFSLMATCQLRQWRGDRTARTESIGTTQEVALLIHFHVSLWDAPPCVFLPILIGW